VKIPISACGGISDWEDVIEYVMLGATTVQTCTSIMWNGYGYFKTLLEGISGYMEREGLPSLDAIRGKALPFIVPIDELAKRPPMIVRVDPDTCLNLTKGGCKACGRVCFYGAIRFAPKLRLNPRCCDGCGLCTEICPARALKMVPL